MATRAMHAWIGMMCLLVAIERMAGEASSFNTITARGASTSISTTQ
jgi:hypothetical protein